MMHATHLQAAVDAAELACHGLTDRHVVRIDADELQLLIEAAGSVSPIQSLAVRSPGSKRSLWPQVGLLRQLLKAIEERQVSSPAA